MEDTDMKKEYMKPAMETVELKYQCQMLAGSADAYGMNDELITDPTDPVTEGWAPELDDLLDKEDF